LQTTLELEIKKKPYRRPKKFKQGNNTMWKRRGKRQKIRKPESNNTRRKPRQRSRKRLQQKGLRKKNRQS